VTAIVFSLRSVVNGIAGAAKKVAGTALLDRNKRAEERAMELGIPVQHGQPVVGHTVVSSMTTSSGRPRSGVRYHF